MTKWDKLFGLAHPEAYGKIEEPEDKTLKIFNIDLEKFNHEILLLICQHLKIDIQGVYLKYAKTTRQQMESHGLKYKP